MTSIKGYFSTYQYWIILALLFLSFVSIRLPGLNIPYHQDEYKWPLYANPEVFAPGSVPHPPLTELIYRKVGNAIGYSNFRMIPLSFSIASFFLVAYLAFIMFGRKASLWITSFFTFSFYGVLASLTVDTDGAILVFFFLCFSICYVKLKAQQYPLDYKSLLWWTALVLSALLGFLVKLSFIIPIGAFVLDFFFEKKIFADKKKVAMYAGYTALGFIGLLVVLYLSQFIFPFFRLEWSIGYWDTFVKFGNRGWFQTGIQFAKALMYLSPFLVLTPFLISRSLIEKNRMFLLFIASGLVFYLVLFDFSIGALDRYFAFLVVPLCFIVGSFYAQQSVSSSTEVSVNKIDIVFIGVLSFLIFVAQFLTHTVPPQHPKTEWINAFTSLQWNFLFPFTGGSGPTGFYMSFFFIGVIWVISVLFILFLYKKPQFKKVILFFLLILGILYNGVFIEEYLFGHVNGSPYALFEKAKAFIVTHDEVQSVVVYNDIGGYEIRETGKYARRMYATPQFSDEYAKYFETFNGHVLYIDIPRIGKDTVYTNYLNTCHVVYNDTDKNITARIYDCKMGNI